ncbi:hypothetical protein R3P38DRAFT_3228282 [Favolaschia claudopus]|uniref:Uncharacterized protein n=1 Tax=Favolaschia claudopus TaxID=2862362 RepID=A0AAV9ZQV8_9AGAR
MYSPPVRTTTPRIRRTDADTYLHTIKQHWIKVRPAPSLPRRLAALAAAPPTQSTATPPTSSGLPPPFCTLHAIITQLSTPLPLANRRRLPRHTRSSAFRLLTLGYGLGIYLTFSGTTRQVTSVLASPHRQPTVTEAHPPSLSLAVPPQRKPLVLPLPSVHPLFLPAHCLGPCLETAYEKPETFKLSTAIDQEADDQEKEREFHEAYARDQSCVRASIHRHNVVHRSGGPPFELAAMYAVPVALLSRNDSSIPPLPAPAARRPNLRRTSLPRHLQPPLGRATSITKKP